MWKIVLLVVALQSGEHGSFISDRSFPTEQACLDALPDAVVEAAEEFSAQVGPVRLSAKCDIPGQDL
jgi:hypothetical protein